MKVAESMTEISSVELFNLLLREKSKFITNKFILDKKDNNVYPIINTPFEIPPHWLWCYLSDISIIQEGPGIRKHQYEEVGIQFLTVTNILEGSVDLNKSQKYISLEQFNIYSHFTIRKGDIVIACSGGSWGKSAIYNLDDKIILNTSTLRLRFYNDLGNNTYLYYLTKSSLFKDNLSSYTTGQQPNYGYSHYSKIPIPLPPLPEQQRIVSILDEAFAAIAKAKANAEQNLKNAKELFESYLQGVFENKDSVWQERKLGDLCREVTVGFVGTMANKYKETGIPFLRSQNIKPYYISLKDVVYIDDEFNKVLKKSQLNPGDLAIVRTGYPGTAAVIPDTLTVSNCSDLVIVKTGIDLDPYFLSYFFNSTYGKKLVLGNLVGAAQKHFNVTAAKKVFIPLPSLKEQHKVIRKLDLLLAETQKLELIYKKKIADVEELKKSLLEKAFKGELTGKLVEV